MYIYDSLIFLGCLVIHVQSQTVCKKDQYTVVNSDGSVKDCLTCATCHDGYGLHPPCGSRIPYPPHPDCIACPAGKFSNKLDSAPCHSCQRCAEHEIVTAPCTNQSDTICSGTCEAGYFYSKEDSSHSCKKCSHCCSDGKDEEIPDCANQGFEASKQHCHPRPDRDCNPGSAISPTSQKTGTEVSTNGSSITGVVIGSVIGGIVLIVAVVIALCLWCRRKKAMEVLDTQQSVKVEEGNGNASYTCTSPYASEGPQVATPNTQVKFTIPADKNMKPQVMLNGLENSALEEKFGETAAATTANQAGDKIGKLPDAKMSDKPPLSRQSSRGSQNSGDEETGFRRRSNSSLKLEKLARKMSERDDSLIEEEPAEEIHGTITIVEEPSSQKMKEGSKVELVFKCKARGNSKLAYQWYKDGTVVQGKDEGTLVLKSVTLPDFGCYKCVASCKDSPSDSVESSLAELNVTPRDGTTYKCLKDIDLNTQDRIEDLLTQKNYGSGGWKQIACKYEMDHVKIKNLENDPEAGKKTLEYLRSSIPDLTVYDFCKALKEHSVKRLDIVKELMGHLSVPSSSNVYV